MRVLGFKFLGTEIVSTERNSLQIISSIPFMSSNFAPVLVTGADTGIGRHTVETLSSKGYQTYAGVYDKNNIEVLNKLENVEAVHLDVTNQETIDKMAEWIKEKGKGLHAVLNNAGISDIWALIESPESYVHRVMNINFYGVFRVTNAVMPFILESKGRVVSIGSLSGTIPTKMIGAYSISKFAVEAYMDVLHFEIKPFGCTAMTIKPGNVKSNISRALAPILKTRKEKFEKSRYKEGLNALFNNLDNEEYLERNEHETPDRVVQAIIDAFYSEKPKLKYLVANQSDTSFAMKWMFRVVAQLNQNNDMSIERDKLHEMLDKELDKFSDY